MHPMYLACFCFGCGSGSGPCTVVMTTVCVATGHKATVMRAGVISHLVAAMARHVDDSGVQSAGCGTLQNLAAGNAGVWGLSHGVAKWWPVVMAGHRK